MKVEIISQGMFGPNNKMTRKKNGNLILIGCKPEQQMMYAGSKNRLVQTAEITKVIIMKLWRSLGN